MNEASREKVFLRFVEVILRRNRFLFCSDSVIVDTCTDHRKERDIMDQIKIGRFIADLRKEKEMTQKELADAIGVSDKTVSKWECGNGMPELSMLMPLCELLQINVNELLSGERLSHDNYSQKAEENIMNLMEENRKHRKKRKLLDAVMLFALTLIIIAAVICCGLLWAYGRLDRFAFRYLSESYYIVVMLVAAALALSATRLWKPFLRTFGIVFTRREYLVYEVEESGSTLRLTGNVMMLTGMIITSISVIMNLWYFPTDATSLEILSVALRCLSLHFYTDWRQNCCLCPFKASWRLSPPVSGIRDKVEGENELTTEKID